ncbi:MAG TPA: type II secretion system F family protein [Acidimicrobiales bacterium]
MLEVGGRVVRTWARRGPDPAADLRLGSALGAAVVVAVLISPVLALPVAGGIWAVPSLRARNRSRLEERRIRGAVPDVVDLFRLAVGAGLSLHQAVDVVAVRAPAPVGAALEEVRRRVGLGARLGDAFDALDHLGDPVHPLAAALRGSARYGAPLGAALERVAVDARVLRRRRAEEDARRLPVQLLVPLVICILPAFGLLAVVPLLLASLRSLQL